MNSYKQLLYGITFTLLSMLTASNVIAADWPMFHNNLALSGHTNDAAPDDNYLAWVFQTGSNTDSSPVVVGDSVFIGSNDGNLYALNKYTGQLIWSSNTGSPIRSTPAVENGIIYVLPTNGNFLALNASNGAMIWSQTIGPGSWDWASPAVHNNNVFIASSTGNLYSLNAASGAINWTTQIGGEPDSPIAVVNGLVYSGTHNFDNNNPTLVAVDETTGAIVWSYNYYLNHGGITGMINSNGAAIVDGDNDGQLDAYFGVYNWGGVSNQAVSINASTGIENWSQNIGGNSTSTPAVHAGKVFIGSDDGNLYALNASDGSIAWAFQTGAAVWSAPAVSGDNKVCFGSRDHIIYCVDENSGSLIWSYDTSASRIHSSPAISDDMLFIGNENGKVYAFGAKRVEIDIKPGSDPNGVNPKSKGVIPVAILSNDGFDATEVDPSTVTFGPGSATMAHKKAHTKDVDGDGDTDLVLHFKTADSGISCGDTEAKLKGQTYGGVPIIGVDAIKTAGCK